MTSITPAVDLTDSTLAVTRGRVRAGTALLAGTLVLVWLISLSRSLFDPMGFDQALYQYITERVMAGQRMYVDLWDQNAPGIVGIHWLSTRLVGRSALALRTFDAGWQVLTLAALIALGGRDNRRWRVGLLAATLYALAYYGMGYVHTAQREGFAVLPLLLAVHAIAPSESNRTGVCSSAARHVLAGVMGLVVFAIKPPLGLCFGALWLWVLGEAWPRRREGPSALGDITALTAGFVLSAAAGVALLVHWGWWDGFWGVLTRADVPGYIKGPALIGDLLPYVLPATALTGVACILALLWRERRGDARNSPARRELVRCAIAGLLVFGLLVSIQRWPGWQQVCLRFAGVLVPAAGSVVVCTWAGRSRIWRITLLLACASLGAVIVQGWFYVYHLPPALAFAAYLSAYEIMDRFGRFRESTHSARAWLTVCLAAVAHLAVSSWGWTMTFYTAAPYVLADTTLEEHYTRITKHKPSFPTYATTAQAARRVRELTGENEPIACLIDEPRLYYLSQRPPVHRLIRTQTCYQSFFPELIRTILSRRPKVVLARVPHGQCDTRDRAGIELAVMDHLESYFGPSARALSQTYRLSEVINDDVCLLQPSEQKRE